MEGMDHDGPQGLAVSVDGYTLVPSSVELTPGTTAPFTFRVIGKDGKPVKSYTALHDKELHLIVVRRDLTGYQHLHPTRAASGTWSVPLAVASAGVYKAFANFQPGGQAMPMPMTLAVDLMASGEFIASRLPKPALTTTVDGFKVDLTGQPRVGGSKLTFTVTRSGKPVDLQPYLGAYGHLVALRVGDLAYLHVHPERTPGHHQPAPPAGGRITFQAPVPTAGQYRLFLDFKAADVVQTAEFTVVAPRAK
ncbi:MAG: hypothetical protein LC799_10370 [Actinobacteria bacterium]|nr:hypothetical protein [Actinomycetota bacterium]